MSDENFTVQINDLEYSVWKFYTSAQDSHHHSAKITIHLPPHVVAQMAQIVQSLKIPAYKCDADIIRDALYHRLKFLADHQGNILSDSERLALSRELLIAQMQRDQEISASQQEMIEKFKLSMKDAITRSDYTTLKKHLLHGRDVLNYCGEPFYSQLKSVLDEMGLALLQVEE